MRDIVSFILENDNDNVKKIEDLLNRHNYIKTSTIKREVCPDEKQYYSIKNYGKYCSIKLSLKNNKNYAKIELFKGNAGDRIKASVISYDNEDYESIEIDKPYTIDVINEIDTFLSSLSGADDSNVVNGTLEYENI